MFRFFENLVDPYVDYPKTHRPPTRLWPFMRDYSQPFKKVFVWAIVLSLVVAFIEIGLIYYMGRVVDLLTSGPPEQVLDAYGTELLLVGIAILVIRPLVQGLDTALLNNAIITNYGTLFRWRAHNHVLRQSVGWFENDFAGRIANRIMQTPPAAGEAVFQVFDAMTFALAYLVGAILLLSEADPRLALPLIVWFGLYGWLVAWSMKRVGPASKAAADARSMTTGRVVDSYSNIHSVKLFAHHDREIEFAKEAIEKTRQTTAREMRIITIMDLMLVILNGLLIVAVVGWAIVLWAQGNASVGVVVAATALTLRLNAMTGWIMWAVSSLLRSLGVVQEGMETIAQPITLLDATDAKTLELTNAEIKLDQLTHHYGRDSGGLSHLDLTVKPGQKVGLVGRSGAGKSTLVKLLLRFYDADGGRVLIDGQDIATVTQDSLRAQIGMVSQDNSLLHRSIRDNVLYGRPDASEAEMLSAVERAEATDFIGELEDPEGRKGLEAHVGERGVKLSGGQRQRIALARVILKDAPILILDEATSALDSEVEAAILDTLYGVMEGKTVIAIAHRLSTISQMDRIIVLDEGKIIEDGSHLELLEKNGLYASFWNRQSGGFLNTEAAE
ncbi:MAG: ABC transporter ATP-binding protein [Pseudomonadota bacterium]